MSRSTREDLKLWLCFLDSAERGISINHIVFRKPNVISFTDASGAGMGGFSPTTGIAWRHRFTDAENKALTLNAKEHLASTVDMNVQLDHLPDPAPFRRIRFDRKTCRHSSSEVERFRLLLLQVAA